MCLKKTRIFLFLLIAILNFSSGALSKENNKQEIINYLTKLKNCSFSFLQNDGEQLSEGKIYIGTDRVRIDYTKPSKIIMILSKTKGMYYNVDLDEDEFFDPRDTQGWFFFEIFNNKEFFVSSNVVEKDKTVIIKKMQIIDEQEYKLELILENNPIILRKIHLAFDEKNISLSIFNHEIDVSFKDKFFKLINPSLIN